MLLMVMLFGAYLAFKQMNKGKIRTLFVGFLLFWAMLLFLDLYNIVISSISSSEPPLPTPFLSLITTITSQIVILWFYYNLLFSFKHSLKIIAIHVGIAAAMLTIIRCVDGADVAYFFNVSDRLELVYEGVPIQSIICKALLILMQLSSSFVALFVTNRLVPIYQRHIEQVESNAAYNLLWIREVGHIIALVTSVYAYLMIFTTYVNANIYYIILIVAYMRMINTLIQHVTLENFDDMYDRLGVKWSWRRMWYIEEVVSPQLDEMKSQFDVIIEWIKSDRPYINPQFSFREITQQFDGVTYNDFDALIKTDKGLNFQAYIRECRIDYATELMGSADNKLLMKEIAYKVGFDSSTSFSRAFKAVKGVAASEWRAKK